LSIAGIHLVDFSPKLPWWGGDLQTIRNYAFSVNQALPSHAVERLEVETADGSGDRLVAALHLPQATRERPMVTLVHGIAGCEHSCYMLLTAAYFLARGYPVLRVNQRGAGPSRPYCRLQYHAGLTADFATLLDRIDPRLTRNGILPIGFSLGGNLLLKYLGEIGRHGPVRRAASVSAPLDLALACRGLMRWRNFGYHRYIMAHLRRNCTAPGAELTDDERKGILNATTLWQFDETFTAPRNGYRGAARYYEANAAKRFLGAIRVPTLLVHARDDPFVPAAPYDTVEWRRLPHLTPLLTRGGGHLGFHDPTRVWLLRRIAAFFDGRSP
jgi:uncharacterized protein